jgi:hypothetical protein
VRIKRVTLRYRLEPEVKCRGTGGEVKVPVLRINKERIGDYRVAVHGISPPRRDGNAEVVFKLQKHGVMLQLGYQELLIALSMRALTKLQRRPFFAVAAFNIPSLHTNFQAFS